MKNKKLVHVCGEQPKCGSLQVILNLQKDTCAVKKTNKQQRGKKKK